MRQIKLTHVGFLAHVKIASRIVSYRIPTCRQACIWQVVSATAAGTRRCVRKVRRTERSRAATGSSPSPRRGSWRPSGRYLSVPTPVRPPSTPPPRHAPSAGGTAPATPTRPPTSWMEDSCPQTSASGIPPPPKKNPRALRS